MQNARQLDLKIRSIAQREREALSELIVEIHRLDSFRGYEPLGFRSLFDYLTKGVGYSAGAAQRRIDASRMLHDVPDLGEKLQSGVLDLHHVTTVSRAAREAPRPVSAEEKQAAFAKIEGLNEEQTQKTVAQAFDVEVITSTKRRVQKHESVRFEITVSREVAELI